MAAIVGRGRIVGGKVLLENEAIFPEGALVEVQLVEVPLVATSHATASGAAHGLMEQLISESRRERQAAAEALGQLHEVAAVEALLEAMSDKAEEVRAAAEASVKLLGTAVLEALIIALVSGDRMRAAAERVIDYVDPNWQHSEIARRCVPRIGAVLQDQHGFYREREMAALLLGQIGDSSGVDPLIGALRDENRFVRSFAARALGKIGDRRAVRPLLQSLTDQEPGVHEAVSEALGMFRADAVDPLLDALESRDAMIRKGAAEALKQIGDPRALTPLLALLRDEDARVREAAIGAIGQIADERAIAPLSAALSDESPFVRLHAVQALARLEDPRVIPGLLQALGDPSEATSHRAASALQPYRNPELAMQLLERAMEDSAIAEAAMAMLSAVLEPQLADFSRSALELLAQASNLNALSVERDAYGKPKRQQFDLAWVRTRARAELKRRAEVARQ